MREYVTKAGVLDNPLVSIIVPVYKINEEYLHACIRSIIHQTYPNNDVILIDDGSPDNCGRICDSYAEQYPFIRVIHQENQGVSAARNHGILSAAGKYIIFVDADDWIDRDYVETLLSEIERQGTDVVCFQHIRESENDSLPSAGVSRVIEPSEFRAIQLHLLKGEAFYDHMDFKPPYGKIIRTSLLKDHEVLFPTGIRNAEDVIFNLYLCEFMQSAYFLNYNGYHYRIYEDSVSNRYNPQMPQILIRVIEEGEKFINLYHRDDAEYQEALGIHATMFVEAVERTYILHKNNSLNRKEMRDAAKSYLRNDTVWRYISMCRLCDFASLKRKTRLLMYRQKSLFFYSWFCELKKVVDRF
ncbi:MAG: glycosyltransferase family 2 protein [Lachnospiraceae bacterium]|nr:glycosyltransferase family 2 protein [Lachnospiraceae bacterium]